MGKKFETRSAESIRLIIESMRMVGIDCHLKQPGEEGGFFYKGEDGKIEKLNDIVSFAQLHPINAIKDLVPINGSKCNFELPLSEISEYEEKETNISKDLKTVSPSIVTAKIDNRAFDYNLSNDFDAA